MIELSKGQTDEVNGGVRLGLIWLGLGILAGEIKDQATELFKSYKGGNGNTSSGGQMNSDRRSNMFD